MIQESESNQGKIYKPSRRRGLAALLPGRAMTSKALPEDVRAEIHRMSKSATESLFQHMDYDEAREVMRYGWPSRYFAHLSKIAKRVKL